MMRDTHSFKLRDPLSREEISGLLNTKVIGKPLIVLDRVDSTNSYARRLAREGAEDGTVVLADIQTAGRGRMGRSFQSAPGRGIYMSLLLRPDWPLSEALCFTAMTAVAVCDGIEAASGLCPRIKWPNDILMDGKKLCGILTELETAPDGALSCLVAGIGVNVGQTADEFEDGVQDTAVSLSMLLGRPVKRAPLIAAILDAMDTMYARYLTGRADYLARYRKDAFTIGREVLLLRPGKDPQAAFALDVDDHFALVVQYPDGRRETISSGEVSVR